MSAAAAAGDRYCAQSARSYGGILGGCIGAGVAPLPPAAAHRLTSDRAVGRDGGSAESAAVTSGSSCGGTPDSSALPSMIRKKTVWKSPVPYGGLPVAA